MQTADFTIAEFLAWARTKPANERYDFCNSNVCAVAQFGKATGRAHLVGPNGSDVLRSLPWLMEAVNPSALSAHIRCIFGDLVKRLEALLPAQPLSDTWTRPDAYLTDIEDVARERCSA